MTIRKHKGINQKTGRLKKGFKYSGKKTKSGLPVIQKAGGKLIFKQKGPSENRYNHCHLHGCKTEQMPYCCPQGTKASGYCRKDMNDCFKKGLQSKSIRKRNLSKRELQQLRKDMAKTKTGRFIVSSPSEAKEDINRPKPINTSPKRKGFLPPIAKSKTPKYTPKPKSKPSIPKYTPRPKTAKTKSTPKSSSRIIPELEDIMNQMKNKAKESKQKRQDADDLIAKLRKARLQREKNPRRRPSSAIRRGAYERLK